jgi:hypothetical protein
VLWAIHNDSDYVLVLSIDEIYFDLGPRLARPKTASEPAQSYDDRLYRRNHIRTVPAPTRVMVAGSGTAVIV